MEAGLALNESRTKATHRTRSVGQYHDETFHRQCSGPDHLRKFSSSSVAGVQLSTLVPLPTWIGTTTISFSSLYLYFHFSFTLANLWVVSFRIGLC